MKKLFLITIMVLISNSLVFAQTFTTQQSLATAQADQSKGVMDSLISDIDKQNSQINARQAIIVIEQSIIATAQATIATEQAELTQNQQGMILAATQTNPLPEAVNICTSNPSAYCPGYGYTVPLITDPNAINWTDITALHLQGLNWSSIQAIHSGVNWTAVNIANGTSGVNWTGINWNVISNCLSNGVNWNTAVINGTC